MHTNKIFELLCLTKTFQKHLARTVYQNRIAEKHEMLVYTERYEMYQSPINMAFQIVPYHFFCQKGQFSDESKFVDILRLWFEKYS